MEGKEREHPTVGVRARPHKKDALLTLFSLVLLLRILCGIISIRNDVLGGAR